jgi:hypothetical protein
LACATAATRRQELSTQRGYDAGKKISGRKRHLLADWVWGLRRWRKIRLQIVPRLGGNRFIVLPKRWIVERTLVDEVSAIALRLRTAHRSQRSGHLLGDDWHDDAPSHSQK